MDELKKFELFLLQNGERRRATVRLNLDMLRRLLVKSPTLDPQAIAEFLYGLQLDEHSGGYLNTFVTALHLYGHCVGREDLIKVKRFKTNPKEKATMSDDEIEKFLSLPPSRGGAKMAENYGAWTLFFSIMAFTGMRPGEVATLKVDTVDFGRGVFQLPKESVKTKTARIVPIPPHLTGALQARIARYDKYLFPSRRGGHRRGNEQVYDDVDWDYNFHARCRRLGIRRTNLTPYSLRHSLITRLLAEDINIFKVQKLVGHKRTDTTFGYTHLTTKDLHQTLQKDPLARNTVNPILKIAQLMDAVRAFSLNTDKRLEYTLQECETGIVFSVHVKKGLQTK